MSPRTRGRLAAFVIVVIALYFAVKYSMLPPGEVAKIKDKVEQTNQEQIATISEESSAKPASSSVTSTADNPAVIAFDQFMTDLPMLAFINEIDKYFVPGGEIAFRERLSTLGNDPLEVAKGLFALQDVVFQDLQQVSDTQVYFSMTASNLMSRTVADKETDPGFLWSYMISMELQHHAWLIREITFHSPAQQ